MSLDIYLKSKELHTEISKSGIFIRENGKLIEITKEEWLKKHPDIANNIDIGNNIDNNDSIDDIQVYDTNILYWANITHNLNTMAMHAGIYEALWKPEEINIKKAKDLIEPLALGLQLLLDDPDYYKSFNPDNNWGNYEILIEFVENYLNACKKYPDADIEVSR